MVKRCESCGGTNASQVGGDDADLPLTLKRNGVNICWPVGPEGARPPGVVSPPRREHGEGGGCWLVPREGGGCWLAGAERDGATHGRTEHGSEHGGRASERELAVRTYSTYKPK